MKKLLLLIGCSLLYAGAALAHGSCSMIEIPLNQRISASGLIVEGKVVAKRSVWDNKNHLIYTINTVEVYKVFKGIFTGAQIEVVTEGGTVGNRMIVVEPSLELDLNYVGVFTCIPAKADLPGSGSGKSTVFYEAYASSQGFLKYDLQTATATDVFKKYNNIATEIYQVIEGQVNAKFTEIKSFDATAVSKASYKTSMAPSISNFSPTTATAGTATVLTINGSGFGSTQGTGTVGFKNADDGGSSFMNPIASQYISWSDTQIQVEIPSKAGTGVIQVTQGTSDQSGSTLTISHAQINLNSSASGTLLAYNTRHIDTDGSGGYTWQMFTGFDANSSAKSSFLRAFDTWRCSSVMTYWELGSTTSIDVIASDGTNVIRFDIGSELPGGVLGRCTSYFLGCNPGGGFKWWVDELDIVFDDGATWEFGPAFPTGSEYDFETVAVHELGHGQQLGHVIDGTDFMHYALSNATHNRVLGTNDITGGTSVHTRSKTATGCGPAAMDDYNCGSAPVADFSGSPTTICEGSSVAFTDLSTNSPTTWSWTFTGGTPSSSTSQNPTIVYNTPGTYNVTLVASNTNGNDTELKTSYITVGDRPNVSSGATSVSCNGGNNGSVSLTVTGGTTPYTFAWNNGATTQNINSLTAGTYTCTVTGNNGCTRTTSAVVSQPSAVNASMSKNDATCGNTDGDATATPSGGTGSYTYSWNNGQTNQTATGLGAGTYTCTVTDSNGCTDTGSITVGQSGGPIVNPSAGNVSCNGGSNGLVSLMVNGGTTPYTYAWNTGATTQNINSLTAGTYTVTVTDNSGCATTAGATVTQPSVLSVSMSKTDATCGNSDGTATANPSGGTGSYTYSWNNGQTNQTATGLPTGTYTCTVTDVNGCTATGTILVPQGACVPKTMVGYGGCNTGGWKLSDLIYCFPVANAQDYEWKFVNTGTGFSKTVKKGSPGYNIYLYLIPGLRYNLTYDVQVRAKVGGVWGNFGNTCQITTQTNIPLTSVGYGGCNTGGWIRSNTLYAYPVAGATYEFKFENAGLSFTKTVASLGYGLLLSKVPGLLASKTYDVTVRVNVGGDWSAFGPMCQITTASNYLTGGGEQLSYRLGNGEDEITVIEGEEAALLMYPNPAEQGQVFLNVAGMEVNQEKQITVRVYDMLGKEMYAQVQNFVTGSDHAAVIDIDQRFSPGIYFVDVTVGGQTWHEKLVVK